MTLVRKMWMSPGANLFFGIIIGAGAVLAGWVADDADRKDAPLDWKLENVSLRHQRDLYEQDLFACLRGELTSVQYFQE